MIQKIIAADSQVLNSVQYCSRATQYTHEMQLRSASTPDYIEKGDLLHRMLEVYYNLRKYKLRWSSNSMRRDLGPVTHADVVDICVRVGRYFLHKMQLDLNDAEYLIDTFREYCAFRADDRWDRIIAVEGTGGFVLFENEEYKIYYQVKIDLILELDNMPICGVDHKSTSRRQQDVIAPDGSTFAPEQLLNQFIGYCAFLGTNNFIKNEIGLQKTLKPKDKFIRKLLSYTNDNIAEWKAESAWWLIRAEREKSLGFYPRNLTSCDKFGGCTFRPVCRSDRSIRDTKLLTMFDVKKKWDVGISGL
jgi:PD-(D/E)XK nuclease superfamily